MTPLRPHVAGLGAILVVALLAATTPTAVAAGSTFTQPDPITIEHVETEFTTDESTQSVEVTYEDAAVSTIEIDAPDVATVTFVTVDVALAHERMDDLDIALVSPSGQAMTLLSDVGGDYVFDGTLSFDGDDAESSLTDDAMCGEEDCDTVGPADFDAEDDSDTFPHPVPSSPPATFTALGGSSVSGGWTLYVADDSEDIDGALNGWSMDVYFALPADPSPSTLAVGGLTSAVTDVDLTLNGINATELRDTEFVLESPDGRRAHVLSDAINFMVTNLDLTLDDEAPRALPQFGLPASGSYRPVDYAMDLHEWVGGFDTAGLDSALSTFDGANPNGTWKLHVLQERCCVDATIARWSLRITTADPVVPAPPTPAPPAPPVVADTTAPTVTKSTPRHRSTGVVPGASIKVVFSEAVRPATMTKRTVTMMTKTGTKVRTSLRYRADKHLLVVDPKPSLAANTTYQLRIGTGVRDLAGNPLLQTKKLRFSTR